MVQFDTRSMMRLTSIFFLMVCIQLATVHAQDDRYLGSEKKITLDDLKVIMEQSPFEGNLAVQIHQDVKNTYFALDATLLASRYEKVRLIELIYSDKNLVNIGANPNDDCFFFLVNNVMLGEKDDMLLLFDKYAAMAKGEYDGLSADQRRQWLKEHDKY